MRWFGTSAQSHSSTSTTDSAHVRNHPGRWADAFREEASGTAGQGDPGKGPMERMSWDEICQREEWRGRWVALHGCRYDENTGQATEGRVVDADDDLGELLTRVRESQWKNCAILFCGDNPDPMPH